VKPALFDAKAIYDNACTFRNDATAFDFDARMVYEGRGANQVHHFGRTKGRGLPPVHSPWIMNAKMIEDDDRVRAVLPTAQWRLFAAPGRFGGLRPLRGKDFDWKKKVFRHCIKKMVN